MYKEAKKRKNKKAYAAMIGANTAFIGSALLIVHLADLTDVCFSGVVQVASVPFVLLADL